MKDLIIIGNQASGKTLLGNWIDQATLDTNVRVKDDCNRAIILKHSTDNIRQLYSKRVTYIYITNDNIGYDTDFPEDKFLIIKLVHPSTPAVEQNLSN